MSLRRRSHERPTTIAPNDEDKSPYAEWLGLSKVTTARWAMSGLVSAHDICPEKRDDWETFAHPLSKGAQDQLKEQITHQLGRQNCKLKADQRRDSSRGRTGRS